MASRVTIITTLFCLLAPFRVGVRKADMPSRPSSYVRAMKGRKRHSDTHSLHLVYSSDFRTGSPNEKRVT